MKDLTWGPGPPAEGPGRGRPHRLGPPPPPWGLGGRGRHTHTRQGPNILDFGSVTGRVYIKPKTNFDNLSARNCAQRLFGVFKIIPM